MNRPAEKTALPLMVPPGEEVAAMKSDEGEKADSARDSLGPTGVDGVSPVAEAAGVRHEEVPDVVSGEPGASATGGRRERPESATTLPRIPHNLLASPSHFPYREGRRSSPIPATGFIDQPNSTRRTNMPGLKTKDCRAG